MPSGQEHVCIIYFVVGELGSSDTGGSGFVFGSSTNAGSFSALAAASGISGAFTAGKSSARP